MERPGQAQERIPVVFFGAKSSEDEEQFDVGFMKAMTRSFVVVPFVTTEALKRMCHFGSEDVLDTVLLEWWLALSLYHNKEGNVRAILPVFCGEVCKGEECWGSMQMLSPTNPLLAFVFRRSLRISAGLTGLPLATSLTCCTSRPMCCRMQSIDRL